MEFVFSGKNGEDYQMDRSFGQEVEMCPFLRNILKPTSFSFSSPSKFTTPSKGVKGPIFEDGPNFDMAFRLFHGHDGVIPLYGKSSTSRHSEAQDVDSTQKASFHPLAASAATISLSAFGLGGPFGFGNFMGKGKGSQDNKKNGDSSSKGKSEAGSSHEALGTEWLATGKCPIAKSYQAVSRVLPLVAKAFQPPPGMKIRCPPAIVAARAALAKTALAKSLRPKPLPAKVLAIGILGMAVNIPLGVWREHTQKFSPSWFVAIHAAIPFIAMLRKAVLMPKEAIALTVGASVLGQMIGSRAERLRLKNAEATSNALESTSDVVNQMSSLIKADIQTLKPIRASSSDDKKDGMNSHDKKDGMNSHCGTQAWEALKSPQSIVGSDSFKGICI